MTTGWSRMTSSTKVSARRSDIWAGTGGFATTAADGARQRRGASIEAVARRRARERELVVVHVVADVLEQRRRQVALAGVGQHADDVGAGRAAPRRRSVRRPTSRRSRCRRRCPPRVASARARRSASLAGAPARSRRSALGDGLLGQARDEVGAPALHQVRPEVRVARARAARRVARLRHAAAEHRRVVGLGGDDAGARHRPPSARAPRPAACRRCRSR